MTTFIKLLFATLIAWSMPLLANPAYPSKPVKIIISLPAGSGPDVQLRRVAEVLSNKWGKPVIVENKPGGSGLVAIRQLAKEPPDGHTLALFSVGDIVSFPILYNNEESLAGVEPLAPFFTADMVLFTSPQIQNIADLKNEINKNPTYGSWAVGSIGHITSAEFVSMYASNATHVPYKDYGQWFIDTINRELAFGFASLGSSRAMYQAGKIHYLAIASNRRDQRFPNVPTVREATGKNIIGQSWLAFYVNKKVPVPLKLQLEKDVRDVLASQTVQQSLVDNYFIPMNTISLPEFQKQIDSDRANYLDSLKKYNINIKQ
jgi:tripartite-type tricarboxylate transporter receptor subunit TctC